MEREKQIRYGILVALAIAVIIPILTGFNAYYLTVMILMLIFIIFASAWNFLTYTGQGSLGHAAFFGATYPP
jgi:branched-chain amino acid transport system permease protein